MNMIFRLVYAAHCSGTHHKLALDALRHLQHDEAARWRRLFLKHAGLYTEGAKAPDKEFKDFRNHVLHVRDNNWGGAPDKARNWYGHLVTALKDANWAEAAYCAGVLSHYYTDPVMPFHTAQSEAENNLHRAVEWSISKSYDDLFRLAASLPADDLFALPEPGNGQGVEVGRMVEDGAGVSTRYYEKLIAHYDIHAGVVDPPEGLDEHSRRFVAQLLRYAAAGFARILDSALNEAGIEAPRVNLTVTAVLATLKIPVRRVLKRLENAEDRRCVLLAYDELQATGRVEKHLSEDDRMVRDLHAKEVLGAAGKASPKPEPREKRHEAPSPVEQAEMLKSVLVKARATSVPQVGAPRYRLKMSDNVVDAPSIGKKTAVRLQKIGIRTVGELLAADVREAAGALDAGYMDAPALTDWQDQARLVCAIPELRGHDAQFLVGGGYRDAGRIAVAAPQELLDEIDAFCETEEGRRLIRGDNRPDLEEVNGWIARAGQVRTRDAA